jgi:hypothetical protein
MENHFLEKNNAKNKCISRHDETLLISNRQKVVAFIYGIRKIETVKHSKAADKAREHKNKKTK